jgi:hypothetical protein
MSKEEYELLLSKGIILDPKDEVILTPESEKLFKNLTKDNINNLNKFFSNLRNGVIEADSIVGGLLHINKS